MKTEVCRKMYRFKKVGTEKLKMTQDEDRIFWDHILFYHNDGSKRMFRKFGSCVSDYTAAHKKHRNLYIKEGF